MLAVSETSQDHLRVFMSPDYTGSNPYQTGLIEGLEQEEVTVIPIPCEGLTPFTSAWRQYGKPDVVHVHWLHRFIITDRPASVLLTIGLATRLLLEACFLRMRGVVIIWTVHNIVGHERIAPRVELVLRHLFARLANRILVHCENAATIIAERYRLPPHTRDRVSVVPHGNYDGLYPETPSQDVARRRLDLPEDEPILLYFGIIRPYKRVPTLVQAFRDLNSGDAHLMVVGNPWSDLIAQRVEAVAAGDPHIHTVLKYIPDEEVTTYLAASDAVVLPYDEVLTSGTAILGMSCARAIIAPESGCIPDLLDRHGGVTYPPTQPNGLSNALRQALLDRDRLYAMGERNRRMADAMDWVSIGTETADIYQAECQDAQVF